MHISSDSFSMISLGKKKASPPKTKQSEKGSSSFVVPAPELTFANLSKEEKIKVADESIEAAFDLVWGQKKYNEAIKVLFRALYLQRDCLGKHHKDVGYTCNFIAATFWRHGALSYALQYFLEARRIFCKACRGPVEKVDERIECIFCQLGLGEKEVEYYKTKIQKTMQHQLQGDRLKTMGFDSQAKLEYQKAKRMLASMRGLIGQAKLHAPLATGGGMHQDGDSYSSGSFN